MSFGMYNLPPHPPTPPCPIQGVFSCDNRPIQSLADPGSSSSRVQCE